MNRDSDSAQIGAAHHRYVDRSDGYWKREQTSLGQKINDLLDGARHVGRLAAAVLNRDEVEQWFERKNAAEEQYLKKEWRALGPTPANAFDGPEPSAANQNRTPQQQELFDVAAELTDMSRKFVARLKEIERETKAQYMPPVEMVLPDGSEVSVYVNPMPQGGFWVQVNDDTHNVSLREGGPFATADIAMQEGIGWAEQQADRMRDPEPQPALKPMDLEPYKQERLFYGKHTMEPYAQIPFPANDTAQLSLNIETALAADLEIVNPDAKLDPYWMEMFEQDYARAEATNLIYDLAQAMSEQRADQVESLQGAIIANEVCRDILTGAGADFITFDNKSMILFESGQSRNDDQNELSVLQSVLDKEMSGPTFDREVERAGQNGSRTQDAAETELENSDALEL